MSLASSEFVLKLSANDDILPEVKPPSSSGLGRHPFKVKVAGSNPAGGTTKRFLHNMCRNLLMLFKYDILC